MAKIDTDQINWTPVIAVFTIVSGILSGFWIYVKFLFSDKAAVRAEEAKQREEILAAFVSKLVDVRVDNKILAQDKKIEDASKMLSSMFKEFKTEFNHFKESTQEQINEFNKTVTDVYKEMNKK